MQNTDQINSKTEEASLLETLFIVRHGEYDRESLSLHGIEQIELLSNKIASLVSGKNMAIFASPAKRAKESAEIISRNFQVSFETQDFLYSGGGGLREEQCKATVHLIEATKAQVIILVTHFEYAEEFTPIITEHLLGTAFSTNVIPKGHAWHIDFKKPSVIMMTPY